MSTKTDKPIGKVDKLARQKALRHILERNEEEFSTQEALAIELRRAGFSVVNQATVNRDIKDLGITKNSNGYYELSKPSKLHFARKELAATLHRRMEGIHCPVSTFLIAISPGFAQSTAVLLKEAYGEKILSTLCGDDSILVVTTSDAVSQSLVDEVRELLIQND